MTANKLIDSDSPQRRQNKRRFSARTCFSWLNILAAISLSTNSYATVLKLDKNGNYVDIQKAEAGPTPYAAPSPKTIPLSPEQPILKEGEPFPDPNVAIATDPTRMENPASQYEIILNEIESLASATKDDGEEIENLSLPTPDQKPALSTGEEFEAAEPGGLVFKPIEKTPNPEGDKSQKTDERPVILKAMSTMDLSSASSGPIELLNGPKTFDDIIAAEVFKYDNVDAAFVKAVISAESNYNATAVSSKGAMGLMQIMPATAETYGVINPFSPEENIRAGTAELSRLMTVYKNPALALAAYNAGQGAVEAHNGVPPFRETQEYIVRVLTKTFASREKLSSNKSKEEAVAEKEEDNPLMRPLDVLTFDW